MILTLVTWSSRPRESRGKRILCIDGVPQFKRQVEEPEVIGLLRHEDVHIIGSEGGHFGAKAQRDLYAESVRALAGRYESFDFADTKIQFGM